MTKLIVNVETGEETFIELTEEEIQKQEFRNAAIEVAQAALQTEADAKAAQRQLLLDRLGITQEEAQLLLGGN
jgi:alkyl sulfatase BDS1-like metallo-beta-lactamase superfamily hydrolase